MLDKHEFKMAWVLISHCTLSTSSKQNFPWNFKEFQLRQIKKNVTKMWRREMQISSPTSRCIWFISFTQMAEVKCGTLITFIKTISVFSHCEACQIIIPSNGKSWVPKSVLVSSSPFNMWHWVYGKHSPWAN